MEESEEHAKAILRIGKKILDEKPEERLVKECTSYMASAAETARDWDMALEMYTDMLEWEEESKKEDIYQKLVKIQGEKGLKDQALEICRKGAEELKDSKQLRILYMRMQCSDSDISREICAQTVKEYLNQIPEIKEETEFQKLAQEYGIVMEGEKCMGRKIRTGALLILVLAMIYTQQAVIYAQNEAEKNMKKTTESENSAGTNGEDKGTREARRRRRG